MNAQEIANAQKNTRKNQRATLQLGCNFAEVALRRLPGCCNFCNSPFRGSCRVALRGVRVAVLQGERAEKRMQVFAGKAAT